jgi:branched-chain amino acid transport system substrate-binding protein
MADRWNSGVHPIISTNVGKRISKMTIEHIRTGKYAARTSMYKVFLVFLLASLTAATGCTPITQGSSVTEIPATLTASPIPPTDTAAPSDTPTATETATLLPTIPSSPAAHNTSAPKTPQSGPSTKGEIKIAILAPLSGSISSFGEMTRDGILLAFDEWNAKGGILGMKVVAVIEDTQCNPKQATDAATKVINQDGVHYIIGDTCSKSSIPVSEIANAAKVLQISPDATNPNLTVDAGGITKKFIYRACVIDSFQGKAGAAFAYKELDARTAFIMADPDNVYVKSLADMFKATFTDLGGKIVGEITYSYSDNDFSAALAEIAISHPDVVYLPDYYDVVNLVTGQAKDKGINVPFLGGDGWDSTDLNLTTAAGGYFTVHYAPGDPRTIARAFQANFEKEHHRAPDALAAMGYDAANLLLQAIENAGADDTDLVAAALNHIEFEAVSGFISFDEQHNPIKSVTIMKVTKDGVEFETLVNP